MTITVKHDSMVRFHGNPLTGELRCQQSRRSRSSRGAAANRRPSLEFVSSSRRPFGSPIGRFCLGQELQSVKAMRRHAWMGSSNLQTAIRDARTVKVEAYFFVVAEKSAVGTVKRKRSHALGVTNE